jgi:ribosome-associated protein
VVVELERAQRATYRDACTAYVVIVVREHVISDADLTWRFSRSSGPGGQNVNTTDTRVQLTFDLVGSDAFPDELKTRMRTRLGDQVVVVAAEHRSQWRNRRAAEDRLAELLEEAMKPPPPPRVPTKPSKGSQQRRLHQKKKRGQTKRLRGRPED